MLALRILFGLFQYGHCMSLPILSNSLIFDGLRVSYGLPVTYCLNVFVTLPPCFLLYICRIIFLGLSVKTSNSKCLCR